MAMTRTRNPARTHLKSSVLALLSTGALIAATSAAAAGASANMSEAQARYQQDRAACMSGATNQDRATCLREAGAALVEARRNGLTSSSDSQYVQNRMDRCVPLPAADQEDCVRRMNGEGIVKGSVEEGGIYRELRRTVPLSRNQN
jgi:hypothetical protein